MYETLDFSPEKQDLPVVLIYIMNLLTFLCQTPTPSTSFFFNCLMDKLVKNYSNYD